MFQHVNLSFSLSWWVYSEHRPAKTSKIKDLLAFENMETGVSAATLSFHSQTLEDLLDLDMEDASSNKLGRQMGVFFLP